MVSLQKMQSLAYSHRFALPLRYMTRMPIMRGRDAAMSRIPRASLTPSLSDSHLESDTHGAAQRVAHNETITIIIHSPPALSVFAVFAGDRLQKNVIKNASQDRIELQKDHRLPAALWLIVIVGLLSGFGLSQFIH